MLTLLPYPNFVASALVLDRARLGKMRVECAQIVSALVGRSVTGEPPGEARDHWTRSPAVTMWDGHLPALCVYMSAVVREWERRGYVTSMPAPYDLDSALGYVRSSGYDLGTDLLPGRADDENTTLPSWLGDEKFHASHRAHLLARNPEWYGQFGWSEQPGEAIWPTEAENAE